MSARGRSDRRAVNDGDGAADQGGGRSNGRGTRGPSGRPLHSRAFEGGGGRSKRPGGSKKSSREDEEEEEGEEEEGWPQERRGGRGEIAEPRRYYEGESVMVGSRQSLNDE